MVLTHRQQILTNNNSLSIIFRDVYKVEANWNNQIRTGSVMLAVGNKLNTEPLDFLMEEINNEQAIMDWKLIQYMIPITKNILAVYDIAGNELFTLEIPTE
jgi:hypothetical protein